jgi:hypothetical protein
MSAPPLLGEMNPKPLVSLKNFTVPCCDIVFVVLFLKGQR